MQKQIVLVEDDEVIRENYIEILADEGFQITAFANRIDAMQYFKQTLPDIAILDISLAEDREGGFQLCTELRGLSPLLPIIFLTSHGGEHDKISGLRLGADDYLTKDISIEYLIVRIEALLRRIEKISDSSAIAEKNSITQGKLNLDNQQFAVYWQQQLVELTLTQYWIVEALATTPGQVKSYQQLMQAANIYVEPNTISAHIKTIRSRFKGIDSSFNSIKSERGIGYRWVANS